MEGLMKKIMAALDAGYDVEIKIRPALPGRKGSLTLPKRWPHEAEK